MNSTLQKSFAFRKLHEGATLLVLPNAWDCLSASLFEQAGFPALATTSGGIASLFGYPDGQRIPRRVMLGMAGRIASVVSIPVTADLEAGYGSTPAQVAETVTFAIRLGLVGGNLEDGTGDPSHPLNDLERQVEIIRTARAAADALNIPFFINARTDVFLHGQGDPSSRLAEALRRANAYRKAGADGIFVIGVNEPEVIGRLACEIPAPLNILWAPDSPSFAALQDLGVARVTFGSGLLRATLPYVRDMARELRQHGTCVSLAQTEFTYAWANDLFRGKPPAPWFEETKTWSKAQSAEALTNLTPRAQQVLALSRREAEGRHDNFVGTEHVLLGLIALGQGVATTVLCKLGLDLDKVREAVERHLGPGQDQQVIGNVPYTPRVKAVLALAAKDAKALNHTYVGTEHLLLGLLQESEGLAGRILREFGVEPERTRTEILKELDPNFGT